MMSLMMFVLLLAVLILFFAPLSAQAQDPIDVTTATLARLDTFIKEGTSYINRICHSSTQDPNHPGKFTYIAYLGDELRINFVDEDQDDYNLLRHNGAIYSLGLSYNRSPSDETLEAMKRAVDFLKKEAIAPVPDPSAEMTNDDHVYKKEPHIPGLLAAWETDDITGGNTGKPTAKLGGAGLALIALVSLEQVAPGSTELDYMRQVGEFIAFLQNKDGSFYCRYRPHKGGKDDSWTSLYYPGEAALGLLYLASIDDNEETRQKWIDTATKALLYLEDLRRTQDLEEVEPDHWALLATAKLLPLLDNTTSDYWRVYQHGVKVVQSMLAVLSNDELVENHGCHTADRRTCPTATRLEGLLAAMTFVGEDELFVVDWEPKVERLRDRMMYWIEMGADFLLESQETDTTFSMQGGVPVKHPTLKDDDYEVRVDYVQHSMSGMIAYEKLLIEKKNESRGPGARVKQMIANHGNFRVPSRVSSSEGGSNGAFFIMIAVIALIAMAAYGIIRKPKKTRVL